MTNRQKRYQLNLDAVEELGGLLRICGSSKDRETKLLESSWRERLLYHHRGQCMYGYKAVLKAARRGGTYEHWIMPETPRIYCHQRTRNRNWKGLTRTKRGRTLLQSDHMNQLGALRCSECNPIDYENW